MSGGQRLESVWARKGLASSNLAPSANPATTSRLLRGFAYIAAMGDLVFISHSNADKSVADAICAELERAGIRCWIAPRDITPGRIWGEAIIDGINASRVMILVHSKHSNRSPQVIREIERAVNGRLLLLQVRMAEIKPSRALEFYLASSQWLDAFPGPIDAYLQSLPRLVQNLLAESVRTGEHSAEYSAEHPAEQQAPAPKAHDAHRAPARDARPEVRIEPRANELEFKATDAPTAAVPSKPSTFSVQMIGSLLAAVLAVALIGSWVITQINKEDIALAVPDSLGSKSGETPRKDSSVDTVAKNAPVAKDPPIVPNPAPPPAPALRIAAVTTTYRVGDAFSLRVEPKGTLALRWRSGNNRVISVATGGSVFRANTVGSAYLYAVSGEQSDSVRIKVIERAPASTPTDPVSLPGPPPTSATSSGARRETTSVGSGEPAKPSATLTDAVALTKASECLQAVVQHNTNWVRAHYGSQLTLDDAANLKNLEALFAKSGYQAALLSAAKYAGNAVHFSMRVGYRGGFGPRLSADVPFEVKMSGDQPQGAPETCRVRGVLKAP